MIILMRAPFLPKFSSLCMCGIRSCGCRGTSSLQTSRSASSDRRFQHPRVPLEGPEKFSRVALLYNFYTDYFTSPRIIYRALFSALSSFSIQKKGCSLIKLATLLIVPSTLSTETERRNAFKKKFLFFFFFLCCKDYMSLHVYFLLRQRMQFVFVAEITGTKFIL